MGGNAPGMDQDPSKTAADVQPIFFSTTAALAATNGPSTGAPECRNAGAVRRIWAAKNYMEKRKSTKLDSPKDLVGFVAQLQIEPAQLAVVPSHYEMVAGWVHV